MVADSSGVVVNDFADNPIHRLRSYLVSRKWWSEEEEKDLLKRNKAEVMKAFSRAEKLPKPKLGEMFNDVWGVSPGEEVPAVIVGHLVPQTTLFLLHHKLITVSDRAKGRTWKAIEEIFGSLAFLEERAEEVRRTRGRCHGL